MYPNLDYHQLDASSYAEKVVYNSLKNLSNDYYIFHSISASGLLKNPNKVIDGEIDFVILNVNRGILVVEVKGGEMRCYNGQWFQRNSKTLEENYAKNPYEQANSNKYALLNLLRDNNIEEIAVNTLVWFPSVDVIPKNLRDHERTITLSKSSLENVNKEILRIFDYYNSNLTRKLNEREIQIIVDHISPNFDLIQTLGSKLEEMNNKYVQLTNEQARLLDYLDEQEEACINGAAGTGKTLIAFEKAKRLAVSGKVLFLCYNRLLAQYLRENIDDNLSINVYNLYELTSKVQSIYGKYEDINDDSISDFLMSKNFDNLDYVHIIIDEGQDFSDDHIQILKAYTKVKGGHFYVFYDKRQLVHYNNSTNLDWVNDMQCKLYLSLNCRNTVQIAETSMSLFDDVKIKKDRMINGELSKFIHCSTKLEALDKLKNLIDDYILNGVRAEDITVVTLKTFQESILNDVNKIGNRYLSIDKVEKSHVRFTTSRKFKGLESSIVIVIDFDDSSMNTLENRNSFYVACSRAKSYLHILGVIDDQKAKVILNKIGVEVKKNYIPNLIKKLKCKLHNQI